MNPFSYEIIEKMSAAAQAKARPEDVKVAIKKFKEVADGVLYEDQFCKVNSAYCFFNFPFSSQARSLKLKDTMPRSSPNTSL